ncbi:MAG TPA: outer membrane protein assembly factor BamD [Gemmatimonadales bacterium]|jgi:outer membrane protein assembly factor BamD|nr:outer membrane protein assembly factor BamD [Gemmatimonadales bacterium]
MIRRLSLWALLLLAGCGGRGGKGNAAPAPVTATGASAATIDSLWSRAEWAVHHGKWGDAEKLLDRVNLEFSPGDPRVGRAHYYLGEALFAQKRQLEAAREFRRASDETPNDPIAPEALLRLGDVYADLWRRPELDPTYGQTALSTYQELLNRYPGSSAAKRGQLRVAELNERFATKEFKAGMFYFRLKAYDSAILYLKDVVATYPKATVVPEALIKLVQAYKALGYREDVQETCGYIRRFHPRAPQVGEVCPSKPAA